MLALAAPAAAVEIAPGVPLRRGDILVADGNQVTHVDPVDGTKTLVSDDEALEQLRGIAGNDSGRIFVGDLDDDGLYQIIPGLGWAVLVGADLLGVRGILIESDTSLLVASFSRIERYDLTTLEPTTLISEIGVLGLGGMFRQDNGTLLFTSAGFFGDQTTDGAIRLWSEQSGVATLWAGPPLVDPVSVARDSDNSIWIADFGANAIFRMATQASDPVLQYTRDSPVAIAFDRGGDLIVSDHSGIGRIRTSDGLATPIASGFNSLEVRFALVPEPGGVAGAGAALLALGWLASPGTGCRRRRAGAGSRRSDWTPPRECA